MPGLGSDVGEIMIWDPPSYFVIRRNTHPAFPPIKSPLTNPSLPVAAPHAWTTGGLEQFDDK
jgi:hypothetical protein